MKVGFGFGLAHRRGAAVRTASPFPAPSPSPTPSPTPSPSPHPVSAPTAPGHLANAVTPYAAYGPQRVVAGYDGPLLTLRRTDGATLDLVPQAGGDYPDYAAIEAWAGSDIPTVAALHDQSGNGRHMVQGTVSEQPLFDTSRRFGTLVPICFDGYGRTSTAANPHRQRTLSTGSLTGLDAVAMSAFMAMAPQASYNRTGHWFASDAGGTNGGIMTQRNLTLCHNAEKTS